MTNGEGAYVLPFVPIGRYTLTVTLTGFSTTKREGIEVRVGDRLRFDLVAAARRRDRRGDRALAKRRCSIPARANRGQVINREQVADLPLLGRNPFSLAQLSPGVQYTPALASRSNRPFDNGGMDNFRISGSRAFTNEFLLDGVPNTGTETTQPNNLSFVPSPDATAEFKVQTSIYDAQYGRTGGGVVNVVLKSGTNQFHGNFYEYYRDEKLNANTFDANRGGHSEGRPLLESARAAPSTARCGSPASTTAPTRRSSCTTGSRSAARCRSRRSTPCRARSSAPATSRRRAPPTAARSPSTIR